MKLYISPRVHIVHSRTASRRANAAIAFFFALPFFLLTIRPYAVRATGSS